MGMFGFIVLVFSLAFAEPVKILKLRDAASVEAEYCRVETGAHFEGCGKPSSMDKLDVYFVPEAMGKRIEAHIWDSFKKGYHMDLNKKDLFHGHFMNRGPSVNYKSADEYFTDTQVSLYHSKEYLNTWQSIPLEDNPFLAVRPDQRSFVGFFIGEDDTVTAAIDLIRKDLYPEPYPIKFLRGYKTAGTVYTEDINESQHYSLHNYTSFGGHDKLFVNSCAPSDKECVPCEIFSMAFILEQKDGRFTAPDGKRFDVTVHCRYYNKH